MRTPRPTAAPEWKQFLRLGDELRKLPDAAAQCGHLTRTFQEEFGGQAQIWLAAPFYPLPGEMEVDTLPAAPAPEDVRRVLDTHALSCSAGSEPDSQPSARVAVPLLNQDSLLGILSIERPADQPFTQAELNRLDGLAAHAAGAMQTHRQVVLKNWRYEQLALVRQVSAQIANVLDLDDLCKRVTQLIQQTFHYYYVGIFTLDESSQQLVFRGSASISGAPDHPLVIHPKLGDGMIGYVASTGIEHLAQDVRSDPIYRHFDVLPETRSEITLPLKVEDRVLGVLDVQSDQLDSFHEMDRLVLRALSDNIALAVESARLYSDLRWQADQMAAVYEISHALNSILDPNQLLEAVVEMIQKRFGHPFVHLFTVHSGRRKVIYQVGSGERSQAMRSLELMYDMDAPLGLIPWVARNGQTVLANDVSKDTRYRPALLPPYDTHSELTVPLKIGDEVTGVMDIQSDQLNAFDESDRTLFESLAASIAIAMRNASLYRSEKWRRQVADSFRDVAYLLSSNIPLDRLLDTILTQLERNLPCDASAIWLLNNNQPGQNHQLRLAAVHNVPTEKIIQARETNPAVRDWLDHALSLETPSIRHPGEPFGPLGAALELPPDYSSLAAPLRAGDQSLGIITLAHRNAGRYGSEASSMTATYASYAAVAIQNADLYAQAQEQAWVSTVLLQVSEATQSVDTLDELLATMTRLTPLLVGVKKNAIFLWEETLQGFVLAAQYGLENPPVDYVFLPRELPIFAKLKNTPGPLFIEDAERELRLPSAAVPADHLLVMLPLQVRGEVLGGFLVALQPNNGNVRHEFDRRNLAILQGIAHQTAVSVENSRLVEARQQEAYVTAVLLQVAQAVVSQNNLQDILDTIVHLIPILVGVETCIIYLWDEPRQTYTPAQVFAASRQQENELHKQTFAAGQFVLLDMVRAQDAPYLCALTEPKLPFSAWASQPGVQPAEMPPPSQAISENLLFAVPLSVKGEHFGVLLALETNASPTFRDKRLEIITGVAQQTALAVQNEQFQKQVVVRERLEREFQLARQIQRTFLPSQLPEYEGWELDARWQPARQVGGDFYDIFRLDENHIGLVIADVSDKGMPAALYMTVTRTLLRANAQNATSPAGVLERVNNLLLLDAQNGMFITCIYGILSLSDGILNYANAGHNRPYRIKPGGQIEQLPKGGMALGIMEDIHIPAYPIAIQPGETLLLYTDGVTECFSADGEPYGDERLRAFLQSGGCENVHSLLNGVDVQLKNFRQGADPSDDVTMLAIRRLK